MLYLKQSTASQSALLGPFVDDTDGVTAETGLTIANTDIRLSANGGNMAAKNFGGGTHDENGWYAITLDATDTATVGRLQVSCKVSGALPVFLECQVLEEAIYDALIGASATGFDSNGRVDVGKWIGTAVTLSSNSKPDVNVDEWADVALATTNPLPNAVAGATGGVFIAGTNAATTVTTSFTTTFTGNLTGSVGSVTGAVGSVTGSVGSVTGSVGSLVGHTVQTGDTFAQLPTNFSDLAITVTTGRVDVGLIEGLDATDQIRDAILSDSTTIDGMNLNSFTGVANISSLVVSAGGAVDSLVQGYLDTTLMETSVGNISGNHVVFWDNANAATTKVVDDVGGGSLTAAAIADAVWDEAQADHVSAGSFGLIASEIADILVDTAEIGTAGAGLTNLAGITNISSLVVSVGGSVDSLVQGYLNNTIAETTPDNIAANFETFWDNANALTVQTVDDVGGGSLTAAAIADAVWDEAQADHVAAGSFGLIASEIADILVDTADMQPKLGTITDLGAGATVGDNLADIAGATFSTTTDSLEAIRNRGDAEWTTGAGGSDRLLMVDTTIATLSTQTSFTLAAGSTDDDAYNGCTIVVEDVSTSTQKAIGIIDDYTGSTKTVTLLEDPAVFTMAATDKVYVLAEKGLKPTTAADYHVDVTSGGNVGIDWANVENPTTALDLSGTDIQLCDTVTTLTGHTAQTGDTFALANGAAGFVAIDTVVDSILTDTGTSIPSTLTGIDSKIDTVDGVVDSILTDTNAILVDTAEIGGAGAGLSSIPWNSAWESQIEEADRHLLNSTTIATLSSQTSFTLTGGSSDDDAYNGCVIVVENQLTLAQKAVGVVDDYTGSTKTVTLLEDPGVFTMASGDNVYVLADKSLKPTTQQDYHVDVTSGGNVGIDWANVESPTTAVDLSGTDIQLCDTVTTLTGHTAQTGDTFAQLPTNFSALVITAGGSVDSLCQGFLNTVIAESTAGRIAANFDNFYDNGDSLTTKTVDDVGADVPQVLQSTTIATLASQTSFTLTAGSADDDAYNGMFAIVTDSSTAVQKCVGLISDYTGGTKTVTLDADPGVFTMAAGDSISIVAIGNSAVDVADAILTRNVSNVEATAGEHTLCTVILGSLESSISGTTWTIKQTDGTTTYVTKTLSKTAGDAPIRGVS